MRIMAIIFYQSSEQPKIIKLRLIGWPTLQAFLNKHNTVYVIKGEKNGMDKR